MFEAVSRDMMKFIDASPTCYHVVENFRSMLKEEGFEELMEQEHWKISEGGKYFTTRNGSSIIAFRIPECSYRGFMIAASHSDSPSFKLKEKHEMDAGGQYVKLNVEKYGGMLMAPWMDRPLSVAGRVLVEHEGSFESRLVNIDRDLVLIPNLAIHMNREANEGVALNPQKDMLPLFGMAGEKDRLMRMAAEQARVRPEQILSSDLFLYNRVPGTVWGAENEFISCSRLDDLQCAYGTMKGLLKAENRTHVAMCAVFDNEEVGSGTKQGAGSTLLEDVMGRINEAMGRNREEYLISVADSFMVSADNGHALHPNYMDKADVDNRPFLNGGIVIKHSANQKYTTDSISAGLFKAVCKAAGVPFQTFVNRSDILGGSTLGNISNSHVSLNTVDIGLPELAMHSPYETCGVKDTAYLLSAMETFFSSGIFCEGNGRYRLGTE